jgi:hypothetical protein
MSDKKPDEKQPCAGYCGRAATTDVIRYASKLFRDEDGHLRYEVIEPPPKIPACDDCARRALAGQAFFTYCARDDHWGATGHECRGGCGRRLYGWILEA